MDDNFCDCGHCDMIDQELERGCFAPEDYSFKTVCLDPEEMSDTKEDPFGLPPLEDVPANAAKGRVRSRIWACAPNA